MKPSLLNLASVRAKSHANAIDNEQAKASMDSSRHSTAIDYDDSAFSGLDLKPDNVASTERNLKSCLAATPSKRRLPTFRKSVSFDKVELREYPMILVDNPCTSAGPPVGLSWAYDPDDTQESDIDSYEAFRDANGIGRSKADLRIPPDVRVRILVQAGYTDNDIHLATLRLKEARNKHLSSIRNRKYDAIVERAERMKDGIQRLTHHKRSKDKKSKDSPSTLKSHRDSFQLPRMQ